MGNPPINPTRNPTNRKHDLDYLLQGTILLTGMFAWQNGKNETLMGGKLISRFLRMSRSLHLNEISAATN